MSGSDLFVVVDEREKRSQLDQLYEQHPDVGEVETEMLDVGDVIINNEIVFERKGISDFVSSIKDRRLDSQIEKMYRVFEPQNSYVIVEGDMHEFEELTHSQFSDKAARGYVGSITARWQCIPIFASSRWNLVDMSTRISRKHFDNSERVVRDPGSSPVKATNDFFSRTVLQLDGVGSSKIEPLREQFGSVYALSRANENLLTSVDGIGSKTAKSIVKQFNGEE